MEATNETQAVVQISDAEKARQMKRDDPSLTSKQIAERIGRKVTYVYAALRVAKDLPKGKRGRPRKVKTVRNQPPAEVFKSFKKLNEAMTDIRIEQLEQQIREQGIIIRYLEGRIHGASV